MEWLGNVETREIFMIGAIIAYSCVDENNSKIDVAGRKGQFQRHCS